MPGMGPATTTATSGSSHPGGLLGVLVTIGPELLVVSVLLVAVSFALRRPVAALPALIAGALLYWGMYSQASVVVMYVTIVVAYLAWAAIYVWNRTRPRRGSLDAIPAQ